MGIISDIFGGITGSTQADAAVGAANIQAQSGREAMAELQRGKEQGLGFLSPFQQLGEQGLAQANFLTDPQAQFDFLQNNPLFQLGLDNTNTQTNQIAAARGRLSAGDTLTQLNNNALLTASPLIAQQKQSINSLINQGLGLAGSQANTALGVGSQLANQQTDIGNALASGTVGAGNAYGQGAQNLLNLGAKLAGGLF